MTRPLAHMNAENIGGVAPTHIAGLTDGRDAGRIQHCIKRFSISFSIFVLCGLTIIPSARAACKPSSSWIPPAALSEYAKRPETILNNSENTGREADRLSALIGEYAATDPAAIETIRSVLPMATPRQRTAIGRGLFAAVALCQETDSSSSARIERSIKSLNDRKVMLAYERAAASAAPSAAKPQSKFMIGATLENKAAPGPDLLGKPPLTGPWSLKLGDPIGRAGE